LALAKKQFFQAAVELFARRAEFIAEARPKPALSLRLRGGRRCVWR